MSWRFWASDEEEQLDGEADGQLVELLETHCWLSEVQMRWGREPASSRCVVELCSLILSLALLVTSLLARIVQMY